MATMMMSNSTTNRSEVDSNRNNSSNGPLFLDDEMTVPPVVAATKTVDPNSLDALFARELNSLTLNERELVTQEIHGVAAKIVEEPYFISLCQLQLEATIGTLPMVDAEAYQQAHALNPAYTSNQAFRLQFLRAERFNVVAAAERMARYFTHKKILFGPEKLGKIITLEDLSEDDMIALECGYAQWLSERDSSGRAVYLVAAPLRRWKERSNLLRVTWYLLNAELEDEETQNHGIAAIFYAMGYDASEDEEQNHRPPLDRKAAYYVNELFQALPVRVEVFHTCCEHYHTLLALKLLLFATQKELRTRSRLHSGSHFEVFYALLSFGIPVSKIPVKSNWEFDLEPHRAWIHSRRQKELMQKKMFLLPPPRQEDCAVVHATAQNDSLHSTSGLEGIALASGSTNQQPKQNQFFSSTTFLPSGAVSLNVEEVVPQPHDVLLGNLKLVTNQLGNERLSNLIDAHRSEYEGCSTKLEKMKISKRIVEIIKSQGGRFLKQTKRKYGKDGRLENAEACIGWMEVSDTVARQKISHTYRNLRSRLSNSVSSSSSSPASSRASSCTTSLPTNNAATKNKVPYGDGDRAGSVLSCEIPSSTGRAFCDNSTRSCFHQSNSNNN